MRVLLTTLKSIVSSTITSKTPPPQHLGRWATLDGKENIRALQACIDSCGDTLCGNPEVYQKESGFPSAQKKKINVGR